MFACLRLPAQEMKLSNMRTRNIQPSLVTQVLDSLPMVQGSWYIDGIDTSLYSVNAVSAEITFRQPLPTDSVTIHYRIFPEPLYRQYFHKDPKRLDSVQTVMPYYYEASQASGNIPFADFGNVQYGGSFGRMLSFGNNQDIVLNSQFNLQMQGDLGDSIRITGAITDNTIPFQPEGNTQQLQEFDKVFIQLQRKKSTLIAGDYDLHKPAGYFMNYYKRVQGGFFSSSFRTGKRSENKVGVSASLAKGKFTRNTITAVEGNQGPYKLTGPNGEQFFIVLAGTEKVFIDGVLLKRGEDYDYTIDYNTAEIHFMPRRIVTKDMRIAVEFEFSDRNYINSLFVLTDEWQIRPGMKLHLNMFSNQDAKNQNVQQSLDSNKIKFLSTIGDSIQQAYYSSAQYQDTFSNSKILYRKTDTLVNTVVYPDVYVYSTQRDSAKYSVSFTYVGDGHGNYKQSVSEANGRVYAWIAPLDGKRQGDYEPVVLMVTPKKQQMMSAGITWQIDSSRSLFIETAVSNKDPNTFSTRDNQTHQGVATTLTFHNGTYLGAKRIWKWQQDLHYEFVQDRFNPLERFRNLEFARDWNLNADFSVQHEHLGSIALSMSREGLGKMKYQLATFVRGAVYTGTQQIADIDLRLHGFHLSAINHWMRQTGSTFKSSFLQPQVLLERQFDKLSKLTMGAQWQENLNQIRYRQSDSLAKSAFANRTLIGFLRTNPSSQNNLNAEYIHRIDRMPSQNAFHESTVGQTFSLNGHVGSLKDQDIRLTVSHRILSVKDTLLTPLRNEENSLGRTEYSFSFLHGLISGNLLYEFGVGREQKREFAYVEVPIGQGTYVWRDYNQDSIKQLNEFEVALFPDEKLYIKVFTPTNQYVKAKYSQYNQSVSVNPAAYLGTNVHKGWRKMLSALFVQSAIQLNNRFLSEPGFRQYYPFLNRINDSSLINSAASWQHSLFINRFSNRWGINYTNTRTRNKTLLNYGIDTRTLTEDFLRGRMNVKSWLTFSMNVKQGQKSFESYFLENRNYQIDYHVLEPGYSLVGMQNRLRVQGSYRYDYRKNRIDLGGEKAVAKSLNAELKYNVKSAGLTGMKLTYTHIKYNGAPNTGLSYTMLDALQSGSNWLWQASINRRLSQRIEMMLEYEGRKSEGRSVIHTGRASVRAIF